MNFTNSPQHRCGAPCVHAICPLSCDYGGTSWLQYRANPCTLPPDFIPSNLLMNTSSSLPFPIKMGKAPEAQRSNYIFDVLKNKTLLLTAPSLTAPGLSLCFPLQQTPREGAGCLLGPGLLLTFLSPLHQNYSDQGLGPRPPWCCQAQQSPWAAAGDTWATPASWKPSLYLVSSPVHSAVPLCSFPLISQP